MKLVRFQQNGVAEYGLLEAEQIRVIEGNPFSEIRTSDRLVPAESVKLLPPCEPSKIVAVGVNYRDHAAEFQKDPPKEPLIFLKPPTALLAPGDAIRLPDRPRRVDYEAELGIVIGKQGRGIRPEEAGDYIFGYTCVNDVTARDLQKTDGQWTRAKGYDTFAPAGPCIDTDVDYRELTIQSFLNGEARQSAPTEDMIFQVPRIVSFISEIMTLLPGDLILTGTPAGVGAMKDGDRIEIRIEGIGSLLNSVEK